MLRFVIYCGVLVIVYVCFVIIVLCIVYDALNLVLSYLFLYLGSSAIKQTQHPVPFPNRYDSGSFIVYDPSLD